MARDYREYSRFFKNTGKPPSRDRSGPKHGEIWMVDSLPFADGINSKDRPVLVKSRDGETILCFKCTSQFSQTRKRYEIVNLDEAGLDHRTYLDYDLLRIPRSKLVYHMGRLSEEDNEGFGAL